MKPYGSFSKKSRKWYFWGDKIPKKSRTYYNKSARMVLKTELLSATNQ